MMAMQAPSKIHFGRRWRGVSGLHRVLCGILASLQVLLPSLAAALPTDGNVVAGHANIQQSNPNTLNIHQTTDKAILNWQSFSIGAHEAVRFVQPSVTSIALNRVIGTDPSVILGQLQANGRIFLINPNGILFGAGAQINVGGLLATTLQIRDEDFLAGRYLFTQDPLKSLKSVVNQGTIRVSDHGFVVLAAPGVSNEGLIVANLGTAVLASGKTMTVDLMGDGLINYALSGKVLDQVTGPDGKRLSSAVSNSGTIQADGGQVILQAKAAGDIFSSVVNQSGVIRAQSLVNHAGVVRLEGSDPVANTGTIGWQANLGNVHNADGAVLHTGTIDVSAAQPGVAQGQVTITGKNVGVSGNILAHGTEGAAGGRVLLSSLDNTLVTGDSTIDTSGIGHSSAGNVVIWSDKNTQFGGTILARGGALGGNGGQIEVSGHRNLGFTGQVDTQAPIGTMGSLLLDPTNIIVAAVGGATTAQVNQFADPDAGCTGGIPCTIALATINVNANITLQANNDITVSNAIAKTNNGRTLTLRAGRNININANVSTNNAAISLTANDAGAGAGRSAGAGSITGAGNINAGTGALNLTLGTNAGGAGSINLTGTLTSSGTTTINAGAANDATLSNAANNFNTVRITSGNNVTLRDSTAMNLGASTVSGNLNVTANGAITDSGNLVVTGTTTLAAGAGNNITLNKANNFSTVAVTNGNNVSLRDTNALILGASTVSGNLALTTGGALSQSGALTVSGTSSFTATAANTDILLATQANNFTGALSFAGTQARFRDVQLRNVNAGATVPALASLTNLRNLTLIFNNAPVALPAATLTAGGALNVTAGGAITQTGVLTVPGTTTATAGANNITLNDAGNNFSTVDITSGNTVTLNDINALALGASTVSGALGVTAAGPITQSGSLAVTGTTTLAAGVGNDITLTTPGNNFSTVGITSGNNVSLTDANALTLNASNVSGNFTANAADLTVGGPVASTGGALNLTATNLVMQSANLSAAGANNVTVTATGGPITMAAASTTTSGTGTIAYTAGTDVTLGSLNTGGGVNVAANGGAVLNAPGSGTNVTAGANSTLQAFNGVVGTQANPMTVNVNPGTLGIRATTAVSGISAFLTGALLPSNTLTLLNVPPGFVCFNGCPIPPPNNNPFGGFFGFIPFFNMESVIPSYLLETSAPPLISVVSTYVLGSVVAEAQTDVKSDDQSVAREIPPCSPTSGCNPRATQLVAPADEENVTAR